MATRKLFLLPILIFLTLFSVCWCYSLLEIDGYEGRKVGGWKEVKNVRKNQEIQQLGKFSVEEFNRNKEGDGEIVFSRVIKAKKQVVSGIRYFLKIAVEDNEIANSFDAIVVVKPWDRSRELISFAPSTK
ncbi:hypothetical protein ACHQM5_024604 [Ranunculus cassubicifolius]